MNLIGDSYVFKGGVKLQAQYEAQGNAYTLGNIGSFNSSNVLIGYYTGYYGSISPATYEGYQIGVYREDTTATSEDSSGGLGLGFTTKPPYNHFTVKIGDLGSFTYSYNKFSEGFYTYSTGASNRRTIANYLKKFIGGSAEIILKGY